MCPHTPVCPGAYVPAAMLARVLSAHPEQGWSRLCNGLILFDDGGALLPDGTAVPAGGRIPPVMEVARAA